MSNLKLGVIYYDKAKDKDITCGLEIVVAWNNERKRFVFSFIDRQIKKSLLNSKDFSATCEASQVGACKAEADTTADLIIAHSIHLSTTDEALMDLCKLIREIKE